MVVAARPVPKLMMLPGAFVFVFVPLPSCPYSLYPQHLTVELSRFAHVCPPPAVIAVAARPVPRLMGLPGAFVFVFVPLPSCP
jgi:hypothetical protein